MLYIYLNKLLYIVEQLLHDGTKEFAQNETDSAKYTLSSESMVSG